MSGGGYIYYNSGYQKKKKLFAFILGLLLLAGIAGYYLKKDSADGRILVWKCTLDMIAEKPWWGHGIHSFKSEYMLYQANYFKAHPDSKYALLADNVQTPYNEYLLFIAEHGIILFVIILTSFVCLIKKTICNKEHASRTQNRLCLGYGETQLFRYKDKLSLTALLSLLTIALLAFFSYPLSYPIIWVILIFDILCLIRHLRINIRKKSIKIFLFFSLLMLCSRVAWKGFTYIKAQYLWCDVYHSNVIINLSQLKQYKLLEKQLGEHSAFLYNWGMELYSLKLWTQSLEVMDRCTQVLNDSDIQLVRGNCYFHLQNYQAAEKCYKLASNMCPKLFSPAYSLLQLYLKTGEKQKAVKIARVIEEKIVKIPSPLIDQIKSEARKLSGVDSE